MHLVTPKVWLISMPSIDFDAMREYLEDVGGESWLDRVEGTMEPADLLAELFIVASVKQAAEISVTPTAFHKCGRCWRHLPDVAADGELCGRCAEVVAHG